MSEFQKKMHRERGQAFAEFVICLVPFIFIFVGIVVIAVVGRERVFAAIDSRRQVDEESTSGIVSGNLSPVYISGKNESSGSGGIAPYAAEGSFDTTKHTVEKPDGVPKISELNLYDVKEAGFVTADYSMTNFLDAAFLNGAAVDRGDPIDQYGLHYLSLLARTYLGFSVNVSDKAFMPSRVE